jgi:hypothetical protein
LLAVLRYIAAHYPRDVILFGAVIDKANPVDTDVSAELFTQITSRFDGFLGRKRTKNGTRSKGITVFDKSASELHFQALSKESTLVNFAEVPLFLDSKMSRHIQLADLIAYSLFRNYEHHDSRYFSVIEHCFDTVGTDVHGLFVR